MRVRVAVMVGLALTLSGCTQSPGDGTAQPSLPPAGAGFDYQLGGGYAPPEGATVVARDSTDEAAGGYAICYVNGFQTQPGEGVAFVDSHPELVLYAGGVPIIDPGWPDEFILDTSTAENRTAIAGILDDVISGCDAHGFDAVEIDNLDSWTRSDGALTFEDNVELAAMYARVAHQAGLAIAQKNGAGDSAELRERVGFDFVVSEECMRYQECADYLDTYDGLVFDIEYDDPDAFAAYCDDSAHPASMILRDLDLTTPDDPAYLYETC